MALLLFPIQFMATLLAVLLAFDRLSSAQTLEIANATELTIQASVSKNKSREVIAFEHAGERFHVACSSVPTLCKELARRPIDELRIWVTSPGLLAGDWILQAKEGERTWVTLDEQRLQFARVVKFYNTCLVVFWLIAIGLGYVLYGRRVKAA